MNLYSNYLEDAQNVDLDYTMNMVMTMNEIERGKKYTDFEGRKKEVIEILTRFNTQNTHKMIPIPIRKIPERLKN